jgi:hypothetical protein
MNTSEGQLKDLASEKGEDSQANAPTTESAPKEVAAFGQIVATKEVTTTKVAPPCCHLRSAATHQKLIEFAGLEPPTMDTTWGHVTGADTPQHRIENKRRQQVHLATQTLKTQWTIYNGEFELPPTLPPLKGHQGEMRPSGLALHHPAANLLKEWATYGCPTKTGRPWTISQLQEAVDCGPHRSALSNEAIDHFQAEVAKKVKMGQAKLVAWDSIKEAPPVELKISPIAAIPHKSKQFRSILDLSFHLQLKQGGILLSVNATTIKTAPKGAIDQLGHSLSRIIHAFAEAEHNTRIFMAKWDIKDGFWRMDAEEEA